MSQPDIFVQMFQVSAVCPQIREEEFGRCICLSEESGYVGKFVCNVGRAGLENQPLNQKSFRCGNNQMVA